MRCNQSIIGVLDNENIIAYNVKFENNFEVEIINLGGVITKIITPIFKIKTILIYFTFIICYIFLIKNIYIVIFIIM